MVCFLLVVCLLPTSAFSLQTNRDTHNTSIHFSELPPEKYHNYCHTLGTFIAKIGTLNESSIVAMLNEHPYLATMPYIVFEEHKRSPRLSQLRANQHAPTVQLKNTCALAELIRGGHALGTALFIQKGADPNWRGPDGMPLLIEALKLEHENEHAHYQAIASLIKQHATCSPAELAVWIVHALNAKKNDFASHLAKSMPDTFAALAKIPVVHENKDGNKTSRHINTSFEAFLKKQGLAPCRKISSPKNIVFYVAQGSREHETVMRISSPLSRALKRKDPWIHIAPLMAQQHTWVNEKLSPWPAYMICDKSLYEHYRHNLQELPLSDMPNATAWASYMMQACNTNDYDTIKSLAHCGAVQATRYCPWLGHITHHCTQETPAYVDAFASLIIEGASIMAKYPNEACGEYPTVILAKKNLLKSLDAVRFHIRTIFKQAQKVEMSALVAHHLVKQSVINPDMAKVSVDRITYWQLATPKIKLPINTMAIHYSCLLKHAIKACDLPLIAVLLQMQAHTKWRDQYGDTPGLLAIKQVHHYDNISQDMIESIALLGKANVCPPAELAVRLNTLLNKKHCSPEKCSSKANHISLLSLHADIQAIESCVFVKEAKASWHEQTDATLIPESYFEQYARDIGLQLTFNNQPPMSVQDQKTLIYIRQASDSPAAEMVIQYPLSKAIDNAASDKITMLLNKESNVSALMADQTPLWIYAIQQAVTRKDRQQTRYEIAKNIVAAKKPSCHEWALQLWHAVAKANYALVHALCELGALKNNNNLPLIEGIMKYAHSHDDKKCSKLLRYLLTKQNCAINKEGVTNKSSYTYTLAYEKDMPKCLAIIAQAREPEKEKHA